MDDLVAFLRARLDEDEAAARAADVKQGDPEWKTNQVMAAWPRTFRVRSREDARLIATVADVAGDTDDDTTGILDGEAVAVHIARHDPARVLVEVDAKRRIIARHQPRQSGRWQICTNCRPIDPEYPDDLTEAVWPCPDLRDAAAPYAAHPDYRQEWRP